MFLIPIINETKIYVIIHYGWEVVKKYRSLMVTYIFTLGSRLIYRLFFVKNYLQNHYGPKPFYQKRTLFYLKIIYRNCQVNYFGSNLASAPSFACILQQCLTLRKIEPPQYLIIMIFIDLTPGIFYKRSSFPKTYIRGLKRSNTHLDDFLGFFTRIASIKEYYSSH
jgi:hypothetical protein